MKRHPSPSILDNFSDASSIGDEAIYKDMHRTDDSEKIHPQKIFARMSPSKPRTRPSGIERLCKQPLDEKENKRFNQRSMSASNSNSNYKFEMAKKRYSGVADTSQNSLNGIRESISYGIHNKPSKIKENLNIHNISKIFDDECMDSQYLNKNVNTEGISLTEPNTTASSLNLHNHVTQRSKIKYMDSFLKQFDMEIEEEMAHSFSHKSVISQDINNHSNAVDKLVLDDCVIRGFPQDRLNKVGSCSVLQTAPNRIVEVETNDINLVSNGSINENHHSVNQLNNGSQNISISNSIKKQNLNTTYIRMTANINNEQKTSDIPHEDDKFVTSAVCDISQRILSTSVSHNNISKQKSFTDENLSYIAKDVSEQAKNDQNEKTNNQVVHEAQKNGRLKSVSCQNSLIDENRTSKTEKSHITVEDSTVEYSDSLISLQDDVVEENSSTGQQKMKMTPRDSKTIEDINDISNSSKLDTWSSHHPHFRRSNKLSTFSRSINKINSDTTNHSTPIQKKSTVGSKIIENHKEGFENDSNKHICIDQFINGNEDLIAEKSQKRASKSSFCKEAELSEKSVQLNESPNLSIRRSRKSNEPTHITIIDSADEFNSLTNEFVENISKVNASAQTSQKYSFRNNTLQKLQCNRNSQHTSLKNQTNEKVNKSNRNNKNTSKEISYVEEQDLIAEKITQNISKNIKAHFKNDNLESVNFDPWESLSETNELYSLADKQDKIVIHHNTLIKPSLNNQLVTIKENATEPTAAKKMFINAKKMGKHLDFVTCLPLEIVRNQSMEHEVEIIYTLKDLQSTWSTTFCGYIKIWAKQGKFSHISSKYTLTCKVEKGRSQVSIFDKMEIVTVGDSFFIPCGVKYKICNLNEDEDLILYFVKNTNS